MELLVIIVIIGIFATAVINVSQAARKQARLTAALNSMENAFVGATLCLESGVSINASETGTCDPGSSFWRILPNTPICAGSDNYWPDLTQYGFDSLGICSADLVENEFLLLASSPDWNLICNYNYDSPNYNIKTRCELVAK